jgi:SulP family sulfate permease
MNTTPERGADGPGTLERFVPAIGWLRRYDRAWLPLDLVAGLTLWGLLAPEAMAYAGIAGLPPQAGLYTLLASLAVYALLGTSRHLSVGATSATAALIASTLVALGVTSSDPAAYASAAAALVMVLGFIFLVAGFARLGFITQFLSKPVMDGFITGLAAFVAVGQLNKLFGLAKPEGNTVQKLLAIITELPTASVITTILGVSALALLFVVPRISKRLPAGLLVLFGYIAISRAAGLVEHGVAVVGELPQGLPSLALPHVSPELVGAMILPAIGIFLLAFSEALGVAQEFAQKHGYEVDADQELRAHGVTNVVSALFGGMIAAGGMSGSAVKEGAGARSQVANLVAWVAVILTVLFLTPLFASLPEAVLAALIIHAVWHLMTARKLAKIWGVSRTEWVLAAITFLGVIFLDVLAGMVIGMVASILLVLYKTSKPHVASLGRVPGTPNAYSDLARHPENEPVERVAIVRVDASLYYANARTARDGMKAIVSATEPPARAVVFDAAGQDELDVTSATVLGEIAEEWKKDGIAVFIAEAHAPLVEFARRAGLSEVIGQDRFLPTLDAAVRAAEAEIARPSTAAEAADPS